MNGTIKLSWLKSADSIWHFFPDNILKSISGLNFLLKCGYNIKKLPVSSYHQQVLSYWWILYKHNFTPHSTPLWNNRCIIFKNKWFYKEWMDKNIWCVLDTNRNIWLFLHSILFFSVTLNNCLASLMPSPNHFYVWLKEWYYILIQ